MKSKIGLQPDFNVLRLELIKQVHERGGHATSSLSCLEILASVFQLGDVNKNLNSEFDFIISKGHAEIGTYLILREYGYITDKDLENEYRRGKYELPGHLSKSINGLIYSSGSLGHGLAFAAGRSIGYKLKSIKKKIICLISDGETCEGSTYEAINFIGKKQLSNILVILDHNKIASCSFSKDITNIVAFESFCNAQNFETIHMNGHSFSELSSYISDWSKQINDKPTIIIADTIKGKGFKHLQGSPLWHVLPIDKDAYKKSIETKEF